jgi:GNAT superfamily N-acetyltransferase
MSPLYNSSRGGKSETIAPGFSQQPGGLFRLPLPEPHRRRPAITDGEYHAFIYDVAVLPAYQRHGVGTLILKNLLSRLRVWRVMLVAAIDVQPFYAREGFAPYGDVMAKLDRAQLQPK